jgi:flagellar basal body rod protein FlgG
MFLNANLTSALDRIAERAADVRRAFVPGAFPDSDDVAGNVSGQFTLDPLAVAAPPQTYFVVSDSDGNAAYTRDGSFRIENGALIDSSGHAVRGAITRAAAFGELRIDPVDEALGRATQPRIERDGTFAYTRRTIDPRSGIVTAQRVATGRVALARFPAATKLETHDGRTLTVPRDVLPHVGLPNEDSFEPLAPMRSESSHVDLDESLARLKAAYVAFDALAAAETVKGHFGKTAMDLLK